MSDEQRRHGGLSLRTLLIAAAASAVAALVIPLVWRPGTVFAAATTPIVVAIVSELLRRPVETVSSVAARRPARGADVLDEPFDEPFDPLAPPSAEELETLPETRAGRRAVHRRPLTGRQWKLALVTGLVAFAAVAAVFTASELLAGESVTGGGRTTFFSGSDRQSGSGESEKQDEQQRKQQDEEEPSPEPTATPQTTATPEPTTSLEATPTPTPSQTPVPAEPQPTP